MYNKTRKNKIKNLCDYKVNWKTLSINIINDNNNKSKEIKN